jgi:predicted ester cyclase
MREPGDVVLAYLKALERADLTALDDLVDERVVVRKPDGDIAFDDRDAWKAAVADDPFTYESIEAEDIVCERENVAVRYRLECIHTRPGFGVEPVGARIKTTGTKIYRVRDWKIVEIAGHDDVLGVLRQLGVVNLDA